MKRIVTVAAALLLMATRGADAQQLTTVHVSAAPLDTIGNVYYAQELGYLKDAGMTVEFIPGQNAAAGVAALAGGSADVAGGAVSSLAAAYEGGVPLKLIAPGGMNLDSSRDNVIIVKADSPFHTAADLNGKTIAIAGIKTMQQVAVMSWVDKHGGDSKTLKFVEVPFPQMCSSVDSGHVDAAAPVEPFITTCGKAARSLGNVLDGVGPRFIAVAYAASDAWLKANPQLATRFAAALVKAAAWGNAHPKESADILIRYSKLDPGVAQNMARAVYATTLDAALIQPVIDASVKYGALAHTFPAAEFIWNGR
jgi:NitT/TauT family transport system substrate-binding protein